MKKPNQSLLAMALLGFLCLQAPLAHAQENIKHRGIIQSVDAGTKTIVLDKKKGTQSLVWDENTRVKSPVTKNAAELKPGMFVLCFVNPDGKTIITVRHSPEKDLPAKE